MPYEWPLQLALNVCQAISDAAVDFRLGLLEPAPVELCDDVAGCIAPAAKQGHNSQTNQTCGTVAHGSIPRGRHSTIRGREVNRNPGGQFNLANLRRTSPLLSCREAAGGLKNRGLWERRDVERHPAP